MALSTTESEYIWTKDVANALEIRSVLAECVMTLMKGKTDVTAWRAMAARRGVGRVHHLDARLSWLQRLWAEGVVHWCLRSSPAWKQQRGRLESKMIDSALLFKGTPFRPPMSSSSWSLRMVAASFPQVEAARDSHVSIWNVRNVCETNGWFWTCVGTVIAILTMLSGVASRISIPDLQKREDLQTLLELVQFAGVKPADAGGIGVACGRKSCKFCW